MADGEFNYDDLPPLVPKGADRAQIIAELITKWYDEPTKKDDVTGDYVPVYTLENVALMDANLGVSGDPIDLRELIEDALAVLDSRGLNVHDKRKRIISLDHCRIDACQCKGLDIIMGLRLIACRFGDSADFGATTFGVRTEFMKASFGKNAFFQSATFGDRVLFIDAKFGVGANFLEATFGNGADFVETKFGGRAVFRYAKFRGNASFSYATFGVGADFRYATFGNGAVFLAATFIQTDFRHCQLSSATVRDTVFIRCRGLYGRDRAKVGVVADAEWADYRHRFKYTWIPPWIDTMHWARLRSFGTLRLVAASYAAFILITALVISARWWNDHVTGWHDWAESKRIEEGIVLPLWLDLIEKIPYIAKPAHFGWQLIMLGILALGATIYTAACPEPIKEASETRWTRELDQPVIEYRAAMYSRFWLRHLCFACYAVGGGYTLGYIAWKGWTAIRYLLE